MAKFGIFYLLLLLLVIFGVYASAQRMNRQGTRHVQPNRPNQANRQRQLANAQPRPGQKKVNKNRKKNNNKINMNMNIKNNVNNMNNNINAEMPDPEANFIHHTIPGLGAVRGRSIKSEWSGQAIMQFFDIPYAKGPVGAMRFREPLPVAPWTKVLKAEKPYYGCPSLEDIYDFDLLKSRNIDVEDCLRLNINTKSFTDMVPVMVYLHGDFLYEGSPNQAVPSFLLEKDVVLVGVRYRLGPFGFLSTMSEEIPGNAAVFDVIAALQWIQKHITAFGGDPSRVTLFGQTSGAAMINVLTMSPLVPHGLFHRVIYQSASALTPSFITDRPLPAARNIAKHGGCTNVNKIEALNKCLRRLNTTELLEAFGSHGSEKAGQGVGSSGGAQFVVGGPSGVLPQFPATLLTSGNFKAYPTMGGCTKNAGTFIMKDIYIDNFNQTIIDDTMNGEQYVNHIIAETNGADPSGAWKKYAEEEVFTPAQLKNGSFYTLLPGLIDLTSTIGFKNPVLLALQGNAKKLPNSTYLYSFDYMGENNRYSTAEDDNIIMPFDLGVSLTDENLYLFPWPRKAALNSNRDVKVAKRMVALWTSFATTGKPSGPNMPVWPPMKHETGPYVKLGQTVSIGENYIDEFTATVKDAKMGYTLVNDDFFESLVEIKKPESAESDESDEGDVEGDSNGSGRGNMVLIAHRKHL